MDKYDTFFRTMSFLLMDAKPMTYEHVYYGQPQTFYLYVRLRRGLYIFFIYFFINIDIINITTYREVDKIDE